MNIHIISHQTEKPPSTLCSNLAPLPVPGSTAGEAVGTAVGFIADTESQWKNKMSGD